MPAVARVVPPDPPAEEIAAARARGEIENLRQEVLARIAEGARINPGNHATWRASQHHFTYRAVQFGLGEDDNSFFEWRKDHWVTIGHDVWIGHGVTILPGVSVGTGAVIGLERIAVMAALNLSHELLQAKMASAGTGNSVSQTDLLRLNEKLERTLTKLG